MPGSDDQVDRINRWARHQVGGSVDGPPLAATPPEPEKSEKKPRIKLPGVGVQVSTFARECAQAFNESDIVFQKDGRAVTVDPDTGSIERLEEWEFGTLLELCAVTYVEKKIGQEEDGTPIVKKATQTCPPTAAKMTLRTRAFIFSLRSLERVNMVPQPIERKNGRVELLEQGYDEDSGVFTQKSAVVVDERYVQRDAEGKVDASAAAFILREFHREFPLVSPLDLSVQICSMVSFFGALLLPTNADRLGFLMKANKHRSGKTLLVKIALVPVMGKAIVRSFPTEEDELRKVLDSVAIGGKPYLVLDDITGHLKSSELNAFMTASHRGGRKMHTQTDFEATRQAIVYLSGHEVTLSPDLGGRVLECRLHVQEADASKHKVKNPVNEAYLSKIPARSDICSALWALILAWHENGRPSVFKIGDKDVEPREKPGFQDWCKVYGSIVMHAGFEDPCGERPADESSDPEYDDWLTLMCRLAKEFEPEDKLKDFKFAELIEYCLELNAFSWAISGQWKFDKDSKERWYEADKKSEGRMSRFFSDKYNNTIVDLPDGRRLKFGAAGKNRHRKYQVMMLPKKA